MCQPIFKDRRAPVALVFGGGVQRREIDALELRGAGEAAGESELALAKAMVARADRALERDDAGATDVIERAKLARAALVGAIERRAGEVADLTDDLTDALLDLM